MRHKKTAIQSCTRKPSHSLMLNALSGIYFSSKYFCLNLWSPISSTLTFVKPCFFDGLWEFPMFYVTLGNRAISHWETQIGVRRSMQARTPSDPQGVDLQQLLTHRVFVDSHKWARSRCRGSGPQLRILNYLWIVMDTSLRPLPVMLL